MNVAHTGPEWTRAEPFPAIVLLQRSCELASTGYCLPLPTALRPELPRCSININWINQLLQSRSTRSSALCFLSSYKYQQVAPCRSLDPASFWNCTVYAAVCCLSCTDRLDFEGLSNLFFPLRPDVYWFFQRASGEWGSLPALLMGQGV